MMRNTKHGVRRPSVWHAHAVGHAQSSPGPPHVAAPQCACRGRASTPSCVGSATPHTHAHGRAMVCVARIPTPRVLPAVAGGTNHIDRHHSRHCWRRDTIRGRPTIARQRWRRTDPANWLRCAAVMLWLPEWARAICTNMCGMSCAACALATDMWDPTAKGRYALHVVVRRAWPAPLASTNDSARRPTAPRARTTPHN